jgi:hypothetical protein
MQGDSYREQREMIESEKRERLKKSKPYGPLTDYKTAHNGLVRSAKRVRDDRSVSQYNAPDAYERERESAMVGLQNLQNPRTPMKKGFVARKNPFTMRMWR